MVMSCKKTINKKPPQRVACVVSILMSSGQDTDRHDDDFSEGAEAGTRFQSPLRSGFPPVVSSSSYGSVPDFFVHTTQLPYLVSLSSVVRQYKINKYGQTKQIPRPIPSRKKY